MLDSLRLSSFRKISWCPSTFKGNWYTYIYTHTREIVYLYYIYVIMNSWIWALLIHFNPLPSLFFFGVQSVPFFARLFRVALCPFNSQAVISDTFLSCQSDKMVQAHLPHFLPWRRLRQVYKSPRFFQWRVAFRVAHCYWALTRPFQRSESLPYLSFWLPLCWIWLAVCCSK